VVVVVVVVVVGGGGGVVIGVGEVVVVVIIIVAVMMMVFTALFVVGVNAKVLLPRKDMNPWHEKAKVYKRNARLVEALEAEGLLAVVPTNEEDDSYILHVSHHHAHGRW